MEKRNIIVIGSSAGGINALKHIVSTLPSDLNASIFIVQHLAAEQPSYLPQILSDFCQLAAVHPKNGDKIYTGKIYVAPPDHHLIIENAHMLVKRGPKENGFRPSIDALMRSAAYWYGSRVVGVVLTGYLNDGTSGLWAIRQFGGTAIVQNPEDADYPDMPRSVLEYVDVDYNVTLGEIGDLLKNIVTTSAIASNEVLPTIKHRVKAEAEIAAQENAFEKGILKMGKPSSITCPECGGTLTEIKEGDSTRYRCHTGHGYSSLSLLTQITDSIEANMWRTLKSIEEGVILLEQLAAQAENKYEGAGEDFFENASALREKAKELLGFIYKESHTRQV